MSSTDNEGEAKVSRPQIFRHEKGSAMELIRAEQDAERDKSARLKELRLAHEADQPVEPAGKLSAAKARATKAAAKPKARATKSAAKPKPAKAVKSASAD